MDSSSFNCFHDSCHSVQLVSDVLVVGRKDRHGCQDGVNVCVIGDDTTSSFDGGGELSYLVFELFAECVKLVFAEFCGTVFDVEVSSD